MSATVTHLRVRPKPYDWSAETDAVWIQLTPLEAAVIRRACQLSGFAAGIQACEEAISRPVREMQAARFIADRADDVADARSN